MMMKDRKLFRKKVEEEEGLRRDGREEEGEEEGEREQR